MRTLHGVPEPPPHSLQLASTTKRSSQGVGKGQCVRKGKGKVIEASSSEESNNEEDVWGGEHTGGDGEGDLLEDDEEGDVTPNTPCPPGPPPALTHEPNTPLRQWLAAMPTSQRYRMIWEHNTLSDYEFEREKTIARNQALFCQHFPVSTAAYLGVSKKNSPRKPCGTALPTRTSSRRATTATSTSGDDAAPPANDDTAPVDDDTTPVGGNDGATPVDNDAAATSTATATTSGGCDVAPCHGGGPAASTTAVPADEGDHPSLLLSSAPLSSLPTQIPSKHLVVLEHLKAEVRLPAWVAAVEAWRALKEATGYQAGKALRTSRHPDALGWWVQRGRNNRRMPCHLDDEGKEDEREDFY
ncbi:hypothetical protein K438DRAFT_1784205 [Mycena galopus ATCC 62051]|nr:hypothetical protein K438DRAFT_1784205 [Mycena galopus ATCC 62051]